MMKITSCVQEQDHQVTVCIIFTLSFTPTSQNQRVSSKLHLQLDFSVWIIHLQKTYIRITFILEAQGNKRERVRAENF